MVVLYMVFEGFIGGHVISAFTIAKKIQENKIFTLFLGKKGDLSKDIEKYMPFEQVEIPIFHRDRQSYFTWKSLGAIQSIRTIIKKYNVDLIHAFDARSYMHAYPAGLLEGVPVLCTLCGGVDPYYNLPVSSALIVFSEEQRQKMTNFYNWQELSVHVIRTRIDIRQMFDQNNEILDADAFSFGILPHIPKIMMISSFDGTKIQAIHTVMNVVEALFKKDIHFQLVFIGGKGDLFLQAKVRATNICAQYGSGRIVFTGPVIKAFRLLQRADIVLGVGRSAFEGMAYAKPTLIIGENGYAGAVCDEKIDEIAWFNFSGRNQKMQNTDSLLEVEIIKLLQDAEYRRQLGEFGRDFVFREIDVTHGVDRIMDIYRQISLNYRQSSRWRQWISFVKCLLPILRDNSLHSVKVRLKPFVQVVKNKLNLLKRA